MAAAAPPSSSVASSSHLSSVMGQRAPSVSTPLANGASAAPVTSFPKVALDVTGHGGISLLEERRVEKEKGRRMTMEADQERPTV